MTRSSSEQIERLPKRVVRSPSAPTVQDPAAHLRLNSEVVGVAVSRIEKLGADPVVIAASPNRFNDIYWSDWRAIRFGTFFTERHDYGGRRDYEGELRRGPPEARAARDALDRLEAAGWRDLFADAFGVSWNDQVLALVLQDGLPWLVFSSSNETYDEENHVFALWDSEPIRYFGECLCRFDCRLREAPPLRFREVEP